MKLNTIFNWYKELPPWAKGVVTIGTLGTAIYGTNAIIKAAKAKKDREKSQQDVIGFVKDLDALAQQGVYPSFAESQYKAWANSIQSQFAGCDVSAAKCPGGWTGGISGTITYSSSGKIIASTVGQLSNDADFLALQAAWGIRTYDACGFWTGNVSDVTLSGAITDELIPCEIEALNKILKSKNISYTF